MIIWVGAHSPIELRDPHNFRAFKIIVETAAFSSPSARSSSDLSKRLMGIATGEGDGTAWVSQISVKA